MYLSLFVEPTGHNHKAGFNCYIMQNFLNPSFTQGRVWGGASSGGACWEGGGKFLEEGVFGEGPCSMEECFWGNPNPQEVRGGGCKICFALP